MPEPINILSLDLATTLGFAYGRSDQDKPRFGCHRLAKPGSKPEIVGKAFLTWFRDITAVETFDAIYIERAMAPHVAAKVGTTPETNLILVGLVFLAQTLASARGIPVIELVDRQTALKFFTGQRSFKSEDDPRTGRVSRTSRQVGKSAVIERCRQLRFDVQDDNAADSIALWMYAAGQHNPRLSAAVTPLFAGAT